MPTLLNPVWPSCPFICQKAWLPSLKTLPALLAFLSKNGPRCEVTRVWQCADCGDWHAETTGPDPSGSTSGTTRHQKHLDDPPLPTRPIAAQP